MEGEGWKPAWKENEVLAKWVRQTLPIILDMLELALGRAVHPDPTRPLDYLNTYAG